jgi:DNA-binding Lrp family transcriptional regulator
VDRIDFELLAALQKNGRASNKELAAEVGLAASSTHARVRRLEKDGVLRGVRAEVAPEAVGIQLQALVFIRLAVHGATHVTEFWRSMLALPEVVAAYYLGGEDDLLLHVAARGSDHLRQVIFDEVSAREEVRRIRTELIFDYERRPLPILT